MEVFKKERRKVLFILKEYCRSDAQNAMCVRGIIDLLKTDFDIGVLSFEHEKQKESHANLNTFCVEGNPILKRIGKVFTFPVEKRLLKGFKEQLKTILLKEKYDVVIAVENPIEAVACASQLKKEFGYKFIIYEIDPASNRFKKPKSLLEKMWRRKSILLEKWCYTRADAILHMKSHQEHFSKLYGDEFFDKSHYVDIPSIDKKYWVGQKKDSDLSSLAFLYCGAFYKNLREPNKVLSIMNGVLSEIGGVFNIYTSGEYLNKIESEYKGNAHFYVSGYIPNNLIVREYACADYLIGVGNKMSDFLPSKTIQYISTGRPIIHFYFDDGDSSLPYLKKYKNALLVDLNDMDELNKKRIIGFVRSKHETKSFEDVFEDFYCNTYEYSANRLKEIIYGFGN